MEMISFLTLPFLASVFMLLILGYLGMHVVEREIIFIDIALAQIAALGATAGHVFFHIHEHSFTSYVFAFVCTAVAALFLAVADKRIKQITHEAIIGVLYAIASAGALFILALSAGGEIHMEHMLTGNILWAEWNDLLISGSVFLVVGMFHFVFRKKFIRLSENTGKRKHTSADSSEKDIVLWNFLFYLTMGLVITVAVDVAGVLVIFSFLIIPAVFALIFSSSWVTRLLTGWSVGLVSIIGGLLFSYKFDFSCGPSIISILGVILIAAALFKRFSKRGGETV